MANYEDLAEEIASSWLVDALDTKSMIIKLSSLTLSGISQLSTHHSSISTSPGVITHSTPHIVHAVLHSAFICYVTSCQSQLASCT